MPAQNRMQPVENQAEGGYAEYMNVAKDSMAEYSQRAKDAYDESPVLFCLAAFGIGVGVGAAISASLAAPPSRSRRFDQQAANFGRRMMEAIQDHLPNSWDDYVPSALKR